jgi:hypothetical protein
MLLFSNRSFFHTISFHFFLLYLPLVLASVLGLGMRYLSLDLGLGRPHGATDTFLHLSESLVQSALWSSRCFFFYRFSLLYLPLASASVLGLGMRYLSLDLGLGRPHGATDTFRILGSIGPMEQPIMQFSSEYF